MKKILFIGTSRHEQGLVEEVAKSDTEEAKFEFQTMASFGQSAQWWEQSQLDAVVLFLPDEEALQGFFFLKLKKDVPKTTPLILVTSHLSQALLQLTSVFHKVRILKSPVDEYLLYRSINDITTAWEPGKQQVHPRYDTDQVVDVRLEGAGKKTAATVKNLSVGGIYFECPDNPLGIKPTDVVNIEVSLSEDQKHTFTARVVWTREKKQGVMGFGCMFTVMDEVYKNLLKGL